MAVAPERGTPGPAAQAPRGGNSDLIQYLALRLLAGQRADDGGWGYQCPPLDRKATAELLALLHNEKTSLDDWRKAAAQKGAAAPAGRSDNSNTQFAVLALWVARRHGVPIDRTMALVGTRFRNAQLPGTPNPTGNDPNPPGSWWYSPADNAASASPWQTMTCSGLLGLAVANGTAQGGPLPEDKARVDRALAVLGREIDRQGESRDTELYFLWSLERVAVLYNVDKMGDKDWYAWGTRALLRGKLADGSWPEQRLAGHSPAVSTSFALLFLKRANLARDLTPKLQLLAEKK
jgi:hypothetical protein